MDTGAIIATVIGILSALVGGLVLLNLRALSQTIRDLSSRSERHDNEIRQIRTDMSECKVDCDRNTVSKEDWVRSEGYTRRGLERLSEQMAGLDGKMTVVEKLPEISAQIARAVASEMKKGDRQ